MADAVTLEQTSDTPLTVEDDAASEGPQRRRDRKGLSLLKALIYPTVIYLLSRVLVIIATGAGALLSDERSFRSTILAWDSGFYVTIADSGYITENPPWHHIAFFPGMPLLIKAVDLTPLTVLESAFVVSFIGGLLAVLLLWKLTEHLFDRTVADRAAVLFAFFPGSYVLTLIYSEAVMIPLAILCIYALLKKQYLIAGLAAGYATAVRSNAIPLIVCCALQAAIVIYQRREWRSLIAPVLAPIGLVAYLVYIHFHTGTWRTWLDVQKRDWDQETSPLAAPRVVHNWIIQRGHDLNVDVLVAGMAAVGLILLVALIARVKLPVIVYVYAVLSIGMILTSPALMPKPRFILTAFPCLIILAKGVPARYFTPLVGVFAALLALVTCVSLSGIYITP